MSYLNELKSWQQNQTLFHSMGIQEGDKVIDFGCGIGRYSIALSNTVKQSGKVYALDVNLRVLNTIDKHHISNIVTICTNSKGLLPFDDESIDCIIIYDLIHQIDSIRDTFIKESKRVLKKDGILSVLPFHLSNREWNRMMTDMRNDFLLDETFKNSGYHFEMHEWLHGPRGSLKDVETGTIYNFKRT